MSCGRFLLSKGFQLGFISILSHGPMIQRRSRISGFVNTFSSNHKPTTTNTVGNTNTCEKYNPFLQEARTWWGDCLHGGESAYWMPNPPWRKALTELGFAGKEGFWKKLRPQTLRGHSVKTCGPFWCTVWFLNFWSLISLKQALTMSYQAHEWLVSERRPPSTKLSLREAKAAQHCPFLENQRHRQRLRLLIHFHTLSSSTYRTICRNMSTAHTESCPRSQHPKAATKEINGFSQRLLFTQM